MFDPDGREPASWCNTDSCTQIHERTRVMSHEALVSRLDEVRNMCEGGCGSGEVGSDLSDEMDVLEGRANDGRYGRNARGERAFAKFASSAIESATFPVQLAVRTGADLGNCAADHVFTDKHSDCFYTIKKTATGLVAVAKDPSLIVKGCVDDPVKCAGSIVGAVVAGGVAKELALPTRPATNTVDDVLAIGPSGNPGAFPFSGSTGLTSRASAREAIAGVSGATPEQIAAANRAIGRGTSTSTYNVGTFGERVVVQVQRPGANGYQVVETVVSPDGSKFVVQKAYDAAGQLVHYDPKTP